MEKHRDARLFFAKCRKSFGKADVFYEYGHLDKKAEGKQKNSGKFLDNFSGKTGFLGKV